MMRSPPCPPAGKEMSHHRNRSARCKAFACFSLPVQAAADVAGPGGAVLVDCASTFKLDKQRTIAVGDSFTLASFPGDNKEGKDCSAVFDVQGKGRALQVVPMSVGTPPSAGFRCVRSLSSCSGS